MKYKIKIKRDFGKYGYYNSQTRKNEFTGFVVTKGGANVIPGAGWFNTISDAILGCKIHSITGDNMYFHTLYRHIKIENNTLGM